MARLQSYDIIRIKISYHQKNAKVLSERTDINGIRQWDLFTDID